MGSKPHQIRAMFQGMMEAFPQVFLVSIHVVLAKNAEVTH